MNESKAQTIARLAAGFNRSPKEAGISMQELINVIDETGKLDLNDNIVLGHLAQLYRQFMPATPKTPKTPWQWVACAADKDDVRPYLAYVHVSEKWIEATDGHRLHRLANEGEHARPLGWYDVNGTKVYEPGDAPWNFPNTDRVVPQSPEREYALGQSNPAVKWRGDKRYIPCQMSLANGSPGGWINKLYLDQTLALGDPSQIRDDMDRSPIRFDFESPRAVAVIMPMDPNKV